MQRLLPLRWFVAALALALFLGGAPVQAKEQAAEFLRRLQARGYGRIATDYLQQLKERGSMPEELAEVWDLEMCKSLRVAAAKEAFNKKEATDLQAQAQEYLDKFLKEHPDHPGIASAQESTGELYFQQGLEQLRQARLAKDPAAAEKLRVEARATLESAREPFTSAVDLFGKRQAALLAAQAGPGKKRPLTGATKKAKAAQAAVNEAFFAWLDGRFKLAMLDFYVAQTYPKTDKAAETADAKARVAAINRAAKGFDDIYQENRESPVGLQAHAWQAKCEEEKGDDQTALDIYDEVVANELPLNDDLAGLFSQAEYFRFLVDLRMRGPREAVPLALEWIRMVQERKAWRHTDGFQGMVLEVSKAILEEAKKAKPDSKEKMHKDVAALLKDNVSVPSEHQSEIFDLANTVKGKGATQAKVTTFESAMAIANDLRESGDYSAAEAAYLKALEFGPKVKDKARLAAAQSRLDLTRYLLAWDLFQQGKLDEAWKRASAIAKDPSSAQNAKAAALGVSIRLTQYRDAKDPKAKQEAFARLQAACDGVLKRWPDRPEADDARLALGQASLLRGELGPAIKVFEAVDKRSERYPAALYLAAQTHFRQYVADKGTGGEAETLQAKLKTVRDQLTESLKLQKALTDPPAKQLSDTQLFLGEILLESGEPAEAIKLLEPLVTTIRSQKPESLDNSMLRVFVASVRAYAALGELNKAAEMGAVLTDLGADVPQVNAVLINFARLVDDEFQQAEAAAIKARSGADAEAKIAAEKKLADTRKMLFDLLDRLSRREQHALNGMIYIADKMAKLGETKKAGEIYDAILERAKKDKSVDPGLTRVRSELAKLYAEQEEFEKGLDLVNGLIKEFPRALEPLMAKGHLLQAWAEKDPQRFKEATEHWAYVRNKLQPMQKKPPEYYEVVYNAAYCSYGWSRDSKGDVKAAKAGEAQQLLNGTLVLNPKLNGKSTVARFNELIAIIKEKKPLPKPEVVAKGDGTGTGGVGLEAGGGSPPGESPAAPAAAAGDVPAPAPAASGEAAKPADPAAGAPAAGAPAAGAPAAKPEPKPDAAAAQK